MHFDLGFEDSERNKLVERKTSLRLKWHMGRDDKCREPVMCKEVFYPLEKSASGYKILIVSQVQRRNVCLGDRAQVPEASILLTSGLKAIYKVTVGELSRFKSVLGLISKRQMK